MMSGCRVGGGGGLMYSVIVCRPSQAQTQPGLVGHSRQSASGAASRLAGREGGQLAHCSPTHCGLWSVTACQLLGELRSCGDRGDTTTTTTTSPAQGPGPASQWNAVCSVLTKYLNSSSSPPSHHSLCLPSHTTYQDGEGRGISSHCTTILLLSSNLVKRLVGGGG